jgi:hypothetical protein
MSVVEVLRKAVAATLVVAGAEKMRLDSLKISVGGGKGR